MSIRQGLLALSTAGLLAACGADDAPEAAADPRVVPATEAASRYAVPHADQPVAFLLDGKSLRTAPAGESEGAVAQVLFFEADDIARVETDDAPVVVQFTDQNGDKQTIAGDGLVTVHSMVVPPALKSLEPAPVHAVPATASHAGAAEIGIAFVDGDKLIGHYAGDRLIVLRERHSDGIGVATGGMAILNPGLSLDIDTAPQFPRSPSVPLTTGEHLQDLYDRF